MLYSNEEIINTYRYLVGGYFGVSMIDEYSIKEYVLLDILKYIKDYKITNNLEIDEFEYIRDNYSDRTKLQDALLLLNKMNSSMDLVLMVKNKLKELGKRDNF